MALAHLVLGLVAGGVRHGYAIERHLAAALGGRATVQRSHVYAALRALARSGFVSAGDDTRIGCKRRRSFRTTPGGDESLRAWLDREPSDAASFLRRTLLAKLIVRATLSEQPSRREVGRERALRRSHLSERTAMQKRGHAAGPSVLEALLAERARRHLEVELWLLERVDARHPLRGATPSGESSLPARRCTAGMTPAAASPATKR
ncbi:PadR family transcriptional regulator [Candidatus Binatia bacterium]|nr:PadR family transcriptional regulator [Candidatus Binatia bacterium]